MYRLQREGHAPTRLRSVRPRVALHTTRLQAPAELNRSEFQPKRCVRATPDIRPAGNRSSASQQGGDLCRRPRLHGWAISSPIVLSGNGKAGWFQTKASYKLAQPLFPPPLFPIFPRLLSTHFLSHPLIITLSAIWSRSLAIIYFVSASLVINPPP